MKARIGLLALFAVTVSALHGCLTVGKTDRHVVLSKRQIEALLETAKPPQRFGFSVFRTKKGIAFDGGVRLHPQHHADVDFLAKTVPSLRIHGRGSWCKMDALLDFASDTSFLEFSTAEDFGVFFLAFNGKGFPYRGNYNLGGVPAYAGVVTQLRIDQLFIEDVPFYVRMAAGDLGPMARGVEKPHVDAVLGYDVLRHFEFVQLDLRHGKVYFSAEVPYEPKEALLAATAKIVRAPGFGLAVKGSMDSFDLPVLLDFVGDFSFARGDVEVRSTKELLIDNLAFRDVPTLLLPPNDSFPRIGRQILQNYVVTVCPKERVVYFELRPE